MQLSNENYVKAVQFMKAKARPLERAVYEYEFESAPFSKVVEELKHYQNEDGGFGRGLEPDLRCSESSVLAVTRALEILGKEPAVAEGHKQMVLDALHFLENTYKPDQRGWEIIPKEAEQSPRAIWWSYKAFADHWGNPNADIVSYLIDYADIYSFPKFDELYEYSLSYLLHHSDLSEMHEMYCYLNLFKRLAPEDRLNVESTINNFLDNCVHTNSEGGYGARPLNVIHTPESRFYEKYASVIPNELDNMIQAQTEAGSWEPNWSWHQYEAEWLMAKEEWSGIITLDNLRILRNFNRIERELAE